MIYKCGYCQVELGVLEELTSNAAEHQCLKTNKNVFADNNGYLYIEDQGPSEPVEENNSGDTNEIGKWGEDSVKLLILCYKEHTNKFVSPKYNNAKVWDIISSDLKKYNINVNGTKCAEKFRNLKKTYIKIKQHNSTTGNEKKSWVHFEVAIVCYINV